ncbi:unnamed protein product [Microthlaspi erraticum]|uniref:Uncharacterized protein n=1 Tax=Microthlaspi erraticum TaxID=1685480 RepID=A0A6D2KV47_9BRAS|nr:unnamed protein product [Microthlaspi erraticum]
MSQKCGLDSSQHSQQRIAAEAESMEARRKIQQSDRLDLLLTTTARARYNFSLQFARRETIPNRSSGRSSSRFKSRHSTIRNTIPQLAQSDKLMSSFQEEPAARSKKHPQLARKKKPDLKSRNSSRFDSSSVGDKYQLALQKEAPRFAGKIPMGFDQRQHELKTELVTTSHDLSSSRRKQGWKRRTMAPQKTGLRQSRSQHTLLPECHRLRQILTASHSSRYANLSKPFRDDITLQLIILNLKTNELGANCWGRNTPVELNDCDPRRAVNLAS